MDSFYALGFLFLTLLSSILLATLLLGLLSILMLENKAKTFVLIIIVSSLFVSSVAGSYILGKELGWAVEPTIIVGTLSVFFTILVIRKKD